MSEDGVIVRVTVEQLLEQLVPEQRLVVELTFGLTYPTDWPWPDASWPPTYAAVGWYVGNRFRGKPLSEAAIRYMRTTALRQMRELETGIRENTGRTRKNRVRRVVQPT